MECKGGGICPQRLGKKAGPAPAPAPAPARGGAGADLLSVIPLNRSTAPAVAWLTTNAPEVLQCVGYKVESRAQCVGSLSTE